MAFWASELTHKSGLWASDRTFNPVSIFASVDDGAFYLHKDYATLWQESTKTTQVSDVEQYIGYRADLSGKGNHSSVVTSTERPLLSARVNQLIDTNTVDEFNVNFAAGIMTENNLNTSHYGLSILPATLSTGNVLYTIRAKNFSGTRYLVLRPNGIGSNKSFAALDLVNGVLFNFGGTEFVSASIALESDGYYLCKMYANHALTPSRMLIIISNDGTELPAYLGDNTSGFYIKNLGYTLASLDHLPYQWVNTATDYDTSDYFPRYLNFDGVDDNLKTTWTNADTSTWTLARSIPGVGAQISTGQTYGSTTPFVDNTNSYAVFLIDRALTSIETTLLTNYLNRLAGL